MKLTFNYHHNPDFYNKRNNGFEIGNSSKSPYDIPNIRYKLPIGEEDYVIWKIKVTCTNLDSHLKFKDNEND